MQRYASLVLVVLLMGCGSTPYRDDYAKHVNVVSDKFTEQNPITLSFSESDFIDLRGHYIADDEVGQSAILYQGGAGIVGLLAQIGAHASIVNSTRNDKLAAAQEAANAQIQPLILQVKDVSLTSLLDGLPLNVVSKEQQNTSTLRLRPIFFSNVAMDQLMLKLVAWIPHPKGGKQKAIYQNIIEVYAPKFDEMTHKKLLNNESVYLSESLSALLKKAVEIAVNDVKGKYPKANTDHQTFFIEQDEKKRVIRGALVEVSCQYQVVRDLHSWFIVLPVTADNMANDCSV